MSVGVVLVRSREGEEAEEVVEKMENAVRISASEEALSLFFAARAEGVGRDG